MTARLAAPVPGMVLAMLVAALASGLHAVAGMAGMPLPLEPLVLAILIGMALRSLVPFPAGMEAGIRFAAKPLLEITIILIGAGISLAELRQAGSGLLAMTAVLVLLALGLGYAVGRLLGLSRPLAFILAGGNAICGNSAISALAPTVGADRRESATAIAFTALVSVFLVLALPLFGQWAGLGERAYGVLCGLTVYAVPQVLAATEQAGETAMQMAMVVKLTRVALLGPLVVLAALLAGGPRRRGARLLPWFIVGFVLMAGLNSLHLLPPSLRSGLSALVRPLSLVAMAGLGLSVDARAFFAVGPRVALSVGISVLALVAASLGALWLFMV